VKKPGVLPRVFQREQGHQIKMKVRGLLAFETRGGEGEKGEEGARPCPGKRELSCNRGGYAKGSLKGKKGKKRSTTSGHLSQKHRGGIYRYGRLRECRCRGHIGEGKRTSHPQETRLEAFTKREPSDSTGSGASKIDLGGVRREHRLWMEGSPPGGETA